jgi:UDP-2-acetamido-3-amino-2,3-dideoxy-glucuronate N-acetyltransferase
MEGPIAISEIAMIHPTALIETGAIVDADTRIWHHAHVRDAARIGYECILGKGVFVDCGVQIGNRVKIQNYACLYHGSIVEDGVFIGPHVILTNDRLPRAITPLGELKTDDDWQCEETRICMGASLGAGSVILPGITIGAWAMVGAGAVVTADVPPHGLVLGTPARLVGSVCTCGNRRTPAEGRCPKCGWRAPGNVEEMRTPHGDARLNEHA